MHVWPQLTQWFTQTYETPPYLLKYRSSTLYIIFTVSIAVFTDIFLYAVIIPVIPFSLTNRADIQPDKVQYWVSVLIAIYGAALLALSPICGYAADHTTSRRIPLILGLLALAGATVLLHLGRSIALLIVSRMLQGFSAAVVWVVGLALVVDTVGPAFVGHAMGYVAVGMSLGILVAPVLGGIVYEKGGYDAVFAMAYALIGLDILLRLIMVEKKIAKRWDTDESRPVQEQESRDGNIDIAVEEKKEGKNLIMQIADSQDIEKTPVHQNSPSHEPRGQPHSTEPTSGAPEPETHQLPTIVILLKSRRLIASLWGIFIQATIMTSFDSSLPLFVKRTFGWDSTGAGLVFLAIVLPTFCQPLVGWIADKYGPRWPSFAGFIFGTPFYVLLRLVDSNTLSQKALLCGLIALVGLAMSFALAPLMAEISYIVAEKEERMKRENNGVSAFGEMGAYAQAYGLFNAAFAGGCLIGPIWAGFVVESVGWPTMTWSLGLLSGISSIPIVLFVGGWIGRRNIGGDISE